MAETTDQRMHRAPAVLDIGGTVGALVVATPAALHGCEIAVNLAGTRSPWVHTAVLARQIGERTVYAALFLALVAGDYQIWVDGPADERRVRVRGGEVAEVDWSALPLTPAMVRTAGHSPTVTPDVAFPREWLPPRYQAGAQVCTTPMGAAPLRYDAQGRIAWDMLWTDFCDLAVAGGPPHRAIMLDAPSPEAVAADRAGGGAVAAEIQRAIGLVTGLPTRADAATGEVGVICADDEMAHWLALAITAENVRVRRDDTTLWLPAGPDFRPEHEVKNVVTAVAKTHHYWTEHRAG